MDLTVDHCAGIGKRVQHERFARHGKRALIGLKADRSGIKGQDSPMLFNKTRIGSVPLHEKASGVQFLRKFRGFQNMSYQSFPFHDTAYDAGHGSMRSGRKTSDDHPIEQMIEFQSPYRLEICNQRVDNGILIDRFHLARFRKREPFDEAILIRHPFFVDELTHV